MSASARTPLLPPRILGGRAAQQVEVARHRLGTPRCHGTGGAHAGVGVEDLGQHLSAADPVDGGVVHLGELRDAPAGQALDHVELPQGLGPVEGAGDDPGHGLRELLVVTGRGDRVVPHVEVDVEVLVLDPVRQVEAEGHLDEPAPEGVEAVEPFEDELLGDLVPATSGSGRRVVDRQRRDVAERRRGLEVQEADVDAAQLAHGDLLRPGRPGCPADTMRWCRGAAGRTGGPPPSPVALRGPPSAR
jgi:hypothetical protein